MNKESSEFYQNCVFWLIVGLGHWVRQELVAEGFLQILLCFEDPAFQPGTDSMNIEQIQMYLFLKNRFSYTKYFHSETVMTHLEKCCEKKGNSENSSSMTFPFSSLSAIAANNKRKVEKTCPVLARRCSWTYDIS